MAKVDVVDSSKKVVDSVELPDSVFAATVSEEAVHHVVVAQLASRRRGTHSTKVRDEVSGGGIKPWKQKGTGRARAGSTRSPLWRGGGIVFGPKPRDYSMSVPKKVRRVALKSALTSVFSEGRLTVVDKLDLAEIKTKSAVELLKAFGAGESALVVYGEGCENFVRAVRNVPNVKALSVNGLNVYDLLRYESVVCTRDALPSIEKRFEK